MSLTKYLTLVAVGVSLISYADAALVDTPIQHTLERDAISKQLEELNAKMADIVAEIAGLTTDHLTVRMLSHACTAAVPNAITRFARFLATDDPATVVSDIERMLKLETILPLLYEQTKLLIKQEELKLAALGESEIQARHEHKLNIRALSRFQWRLFLLINGNRAADLCSSIEHTVKEKWNQVLPKNKHARRALLGLSSAAAGAGLLYLYLRPAKK